MSCNTWRQLLFPLAPMLSPLTSRAAGEGAYGKVYAGLNQLTGELMAVKTLELVGRSGSAEAKAQLAELVQVGCVARARAPVCCTATLCSSAGRVLVALPVGTPMPGV